MHHKFLFPEPVPGKDYMRENFQHIRKLAQSKQLRADALRPNFIPGVTKNHKYEHVQSRVAEFLKVRIETIEESIGDL